MKRNKIIIIGLGEIGLELLKKISKEFDIVSVDLNSEAGETAKTVRADCRIITGIRHTYQCSKAQRCQECPHARR